MSKKVIICAVLALFFISLNAAFSEMDYPQELKKEVAAYPNAKIMQTVKASGTVMVIMEVDDKPETVFEFYKKELASKGWKILTEFKQEGHATLVSQKGSNNMVVDTSSDQSGKSMVSVTLAPQQ